jgi:hypothetical protein
MHLWRKHEATPDVSRIQSSLAILRLLAPFCAEAELDAPTTKYAGLPVMLTRVANPSLGAKTISTPTFQQRVAAYCA